VRIARLELKAAGVKDASTEQIIAAREAECSQYEDTWMDLQKNIRAVQKFAQGARDKNNFAFTDVLELEWVRSALEKHIKQSRKKEEAEDQLEEALQEEEEDEDEPPPPVPPRSVAWEETESATTFEDATRVLRISIESFRMADELGDESKKDVACVVVKFSAFHFFLYISHLFLRTLMASAAPR
jgi:hypothetical protein